MMVKIFGLSICVIFLISLVAAGGGSCLNSAGEAPEELQADELMLKYTWFNGDQEEQVFAALDEVAIFPKNVSEKTNVTERLVKNFDPKATLIKDYEFVILVRLPNRLARWILEDKMDDFQNTTGNIASSVFYKGEKKDQAPMALTGEIIVHFKPDWNENRIAEWAKNMDLEIIKTFPFSPNTYLFKTGPGLKSLEIANQIYISGEVIYAYPNWWNAMELKSNQAMPTDMNISKENKFSPAENRGFERYIWFNGDREEQVFAALDEVAIFPKNVSEKTNVTERLVKNFDPKATLIKDYEFVILVRLPNRLDITTLEDKMDDFQNTTGNIASSVFYKGEKKDQAPMALTGEIIVHFKPDWNENRIAEWAKNMDLEIIKSFPFSPNTYLFKAGPNLKSLEIANQIYISGEVIYAYPNWWKAMNTRAIPDDPLFSDQWHLQNTGQGGGTSGEDVNIISVWDSYRGSDNEVIAIVDDGLELLHEDLAPNILSGYSWDYVGNDPDPTAGDHGTSVAGVAAARGWNTLGVTGAAPNTKLVGYRLLGAGTDANEASALNNNLQIVDIYSNSWGPYDDRRLEGPGPLTLAALASGTANGRGSRGNIYVWAGGNGNNVADVNSDNSNYDGYASSRYVMAIAASSNYGRQSGYSEDGANILVNAPSNGGSLGITTTDRTGALGYDNGDYTSTFGGTSSATPLASGIISLMLQANPDLTWRDVRLILAKNAEKNDLSDVDWTTNGAGYHINHKYGFGRIDADVAVSSAANWTNVGPEIAVAAFNSPNLPIPDNNAAGVSDTIDITQEIKIEFVEIYFTAADHTYWGDLEIELTSPSGTKSILAKRHGVASSAQRYDNWTFGSVRHMGESSLGTWQLAVMDKASVDTGTFQEWGLRIYGREDPEPTLMDNDIAVFRNGKWFVDTDGDHVADLSFWYGIGGDDPVVGNINQYDEGHDDTIIFRHGKWFADTDGDHMADEGFWYGSADYLPVVGDINQDGKDDTIVSVNGHWFVDTDYDHVADEGFWYGAVGYYPVVGDINQDGKDDTIVSVNGHWFADTDYDHVADEGFWYGIGGDIPLVADMDGDGLDDTAVFRNGKWFVDTDYDHVADLGFWYGIAGDKPVVGDIG